MALGDLNKFSFGANNLFIPSIRDRDKKNASKFIVKDSYPYNFGEDNSFSLGPDEQRWPNQRPPVQNLRPQKSQQPMSTGVNMGDVANLALAIKGKPMDTSAIPGQTPGQAPGTFNMAAVNAPEARLLEKPGFDADKFARIAGAMGAAIGGPNTWQGRLGMVASKLAGENIAERKGAPDVAQARRLRAAQIKKAEAPEIASTAMGAYLRRNPDATPKEIADYHLKLKKADVKTPTTAMAAYLQKKPDATPEDITKFAQNLKKDSGKYHYVQDDSGKVSIFQDGKLIRGSGKGKKVSGESNKGVYVSSMNQILKEYGGSGTSFKTNPDGSFDFSAGGEKAYQDMVQQAKDNPAAKRNVEIYNNLKEKLIGLSGVDIPKSTQKSSWKDYQ